MIFIKEHLLLIMVWLLALFISITSFVALRNVFPTFNQILLGHTLYGVLALPNGFLNMVGIFNDETAKRNFFFYVLAIAYWAAVITAHYWYSEENREVKYVFVIAFFVITGSMKWLYFAVPMMR